MHEINMSLLLCEAGRLLREAVSLVDDMAKDDLVVAEGQADSRQTFAREDMPGHIEVLQAEIMKIERMELVLAVVGTTNAGKSTTINAIVGAEVLPARNIPMTALPTLIRHTPGAATPLLRIGNREPLDRLVASRRGNDIAEHRGGDELGAKVDAMLGNAIKPCYEGASEIRDILEALNDLVRLSSEVGEAFPFDDYDGIDEFPVIDVEFAHLSGIEGTQGRLTLLDTPGPNESARPQLRPMLKKQLERASAVLAVLDYTQLKTEADAEVRRELTKVAEMAGDRMYALVNKFDERTSRDLTADEASAIVLRLMKLDDGSSKVTRGRVFPVSAQQAYLSKRAQHEIGAHGRLPDPRDEPWVEDFGEEAFGRRWERRVHDSKAVSECAEELWQDSNFSEPLESTIAEAHRQATALILQSAIDRLVSYGERVANSANVRQTSLASDIADVERLIGELAEDERDLAKFKEDALRDFDRHLQDVLKKLAAIAQRKSDEAQAALERIFSEGREMEQDAQRAAPEARERKTYFAFRWMLKIKPLGPFIAELVQDEPSAVWDPDRQRIELSEHNKAKRLIERMDDAVRAVMTGTNESVRQAILENLETFEGDVSEATTQLNNKLGALGSRLNDEGFELLLRMPRVPIPRIPTISHDIMDKVQERKEEEYTVRRHKDGVWGKICSWLGTDVWGTEVHTKQRISYIIDLRKAKEAAVRGAKGAYQQLGEAFKDRSERPLRNAINDLCADAEELVERIRGDMIQSRKDRELDAATKKDLVDRLAAVSRRNELILADCHGLHADQEARA